jgi:plasmid stability protein
VAQVIIRNLSPDTVENLRRRARRNGQPLEAELRLILDRAANKQLHSDLERIDRVRALFAGRTFSDCTELIR